MQNTLLCSDLPFIEALRKLPVEKLTDQLEELVGGQYAIVLSQKDKTNLNQLQFNYDDLSTFADGR